MKSTGNRENEEIAKTHKGWNISYAPKPGKPGIVDWEAAHQDEEIMLCGKSVADLIDQIDGHLDT